MVFSHYAVTTGRFEQALWKAVQTASGYDEADTLRYYLDKWLAVSDHQGRKAVALLKTGVLLEENGKFQEAVKLYRGGLAQNPSHRSLRCRLNSRLAYALVQTGQPQEGEVRARSALRIYPSQAANNLHLGLALEAQGEYEQALESYLSGIQDQTVEHSSISQIRKVFLNNRKGVRGPENDALPRFPAPVLLLGAALSLARNDQEHHIQAADFRGQLWVSQRPWEELYLSLLRAMTATLESHAGSRLMSWQRLWAEVAPSKYRLTARGWDLRKELLHSRPPAPKPLEIKGYLNPEGILLFDRYLSAKNQYLRHLYDVISNSLQEGKGQKADVHIERLLRMADSPQETAFFWLQVGVFQEQVKDYHAALDCYQKGLWVENPGKKTLYFLHNNSGYCHNVLGQYQTAEQFARDAIRVHSERHYAYKNLGLALEGQGRFPEAAENYQKAVQAWPADPRAYDRLQRLLRDHPALNASHPEFSIFLDAASLVVGYAKEIQRATHSRKKTVSLPAPVQTLLSAARTIRETGRQTFTPGEMRKRMDIENRTWTAVYAPVVRRMSTPLENHSGRQEIQYRGIFSYCGLTELRFTNRGKQAAALVESLMAGS